MFNRLFLTCLISFALLFSMQHPVITTVARFSFEPVFRLRKFLRLADNLMQLFPILFACLIFLVGLLYGFNLGPSKFDPIVDAVNPSSSQVVTALQILQSSPKSLEIVLGAHGIGKSTAFQLAAQQLSQHRAVVYLEHPPSDVALFNQFFSLPFFFDVWGLRHILLYFKPCTKAAFNRKVDRALPPVLIIDNMQNAADVKALTLRL
jgi:hypothetical protein